MSGALSKGFERVKERVHCYGCGKRRLAVLWIDFGNRMCAALCRECAKRAEELEAEAYERGYGAGLGDVVKMQEPK